MTAWHDFQALRPSGGFGIIMADPPWPTEMWSEKGYAKSPETHYDTMLIADIKAMPVEALAARNAVLWLWARNPQLKPAIEVLESWGFTLSTAGHWVKRTKNGKLAFGGGYILRSAGEPFLIGTRGSPKTTNSVRSVIEGPVREHSRKPDEAYAAAEALIPDVQRLDLFSRQTRQNWTAWGLEAGKFNNTTKGDDNALLSDDTAQ